MLSWAHPHQHLSCPLTHQAAPISEEGRGQSGPRRVTDVANTPPRRRWLRGMYLRARDGGTRGRGAHLDKLHARA
eukprot:21547-Eustigmatos_ZCMA.PRE.1